MAGFNEKLKASDSIFASEKVITSTYTSDAIDFASGALGSVEIITEADTDLVIANGQALILQIVADGGDVLDVVYNSGVVSANTTVSAGVLGQWVVPTDTAESLKFKIATATAGGSGTVTAYANYLAR